MWCLTNVCGDPLTAPGLKQSQAKFQGEPPWSCHTHISVILSPMGGPWFQFVEVVFQTGCITQAIFSNFTSVTVGNLEVSVRREGKLGWPLRLEVKHLPRCWITTGETKNSTPFYHKWKETGISRPSDLFWMAPLRQISLLPLRLVQMRHHRLLGKDGQLKPSQVWGPWSDDAPAGASPPLQHPHTTSSDVNRAAV